MLRLGSRCLSQRHSHLRARHIHRIPSHRGRLRRVWPAEIEKLAAMGSALRAAHAGNEALRTRVIMDG